MSVNADPAANLERGVAVEDLAREQSGGYNVVTAHRAAC
jgi:hypothetical protein